MPRGDGFEAQTAPANGIQAMSSSRAANSILSCVALAVSLLTILATSRSSIAAGTDRDPQVSVQSQLQRILAVGWDKSTSALAAAEQEYERMAHASDVRLPYGMALVQMKHRKYKEAAKLLDEAIGLDARHSPSHVAKIWIDLLLKRHDAAMVQMEKLAASFTPGSEDSQVIDAELLHRDAARFLGRALAFLEGPAQTNANPLSVTRYQESVWTLLSADLQAEFTAGRTQVRDCCTELVEDGENTRQVTKVAQEKKQVLDGERLVREREQIAERSKSLDAQKTRLHESMDRELAAIDGKAGALQQTYAGLSSQAASVRSQMAGVASQMGSVSTVCTGHCKGVCTCGQPGNPGLSSLGSAMAGELIGLQSEANQVTAQAAVLEQQREQLLGRYEEENQKLRREESRLNKRNNLTMQQERKNSQAPTGISARVHVLTEKARSLSACNPFPLDNAKRCLLDNDDSAELDAYRAVLMSIGRLPVDPHYHMDDDGQVTSHDSVLIQNMNRRAMW